MASLFEKIRKGEQGMCDPTKRYALTNKTEEPFSFSWNGSTVDMEIGETIEIPQYLAYLAVNKMIDQMMMAKSSKEFKKAREINPMYIAPNGAGMLGVPSAREVYEKMIVRELAPKTGNDAKLDIIRAREMIEADIKRSKEEIKPVESIKVEQKEFAELTEKPAAIV